MCIFILITRNIYKSHVFYQIISSGTIVFPNRGSSAYIQTNNRIDSDGPEQVPHDYPARRISQLIQSQKAFYSAAFADEHVTNTESRIFGGTDVKLCETTETIETPWKMNRTSDGREMIIAQDHNRKIQQKIRYVRCR